MKPYLGALMLDTRAVYHIRIVGCLNRNWTEQFGDMSISHEVAKDGSTRSVLTGPLVDQAALFGVLNALYGLGFALLSVECLENNLTT